MTPYINAACLSVYFIQPQIAIYKGFLLPSSSFNACFVCELLCPSVEGKRGEIRNRRVLRFGTQKKKKKAIVHVCKGELKEMGMCE